MPDDLSRYTILGALGSGGMGEVFLAEDTRLSRRVALKLLPADRCADDERRRRFLREARAAALLNHPNICTLFDVGESEDGRIFITMELVEGATLSEKIALTPLPMPELLDLAAQAAGALQEAHERGLVHRDLKPSNLMVTKDGRLKILDFGLAKLTAESGAVPPDDHTATLPLTRAGAVLGTAPYMSPEQALGGEVDRRSDIFSLGVVLYQMASRRLPFTGRSTVELLANIAHGEPRPLEPELASLALQSIITRCLEKDPARRFQSMAELLEALRRAASGTGPSGEAAAPLPLPPNNLPHQATRFVGREREMVELQSLLASHRLLTIRGAGGSGKTRLALELARRSAPGFGDGAWHVNLAAIVSGRDVTRGLAEALAIKEEGSRPLLDVLVAHLRDRRALLVLDNCEHVLEEAARLVDAILASAGGVRVIVTSREALNLGGECQWTAPPLSLPAPRTPVTPGSALEYDAIRLFVDRALSAQPKFALSETNLDEVIHVCSRLDGIPLAIELAAARIKMMSAGEIRRRLDDCFRILTGGARAALPRHQTMRAAVDWSHDLLAEPERVLFRRLAVFAGGFDLDAAETVCAGDPLEGAEVLDHLARLVDKSLVVCEPSDDDETRYRFLEPIRQYAAERLGQAEEGGILARRHFDRFAAMADRAYDERIERSADWLRRLERDHDNLRAALSWAASLDPRGELRLAGALGWFWILHSHLTEGRERLRAVLDRPRERTNLTARALWGASVLAALQGDADAARPPAEEGLAILGELGDVREAALALEAIGWSHWFAGENPAALARFEESLRLQCQSGNERLINRAMLAICQVLVSDWDVDRAEPIALAALEVGKRHQVIRDVHNAHHFLADCALIRGNVEAAEAGYADSLRAAMAYGDRIEMTFEVEGIAMSLAGQGRDDKALRLAAAAGAERRALNADPRIPFWEKLKERYLGAAAERQGHDAAGRSRQEGHALGFDEAIRQALDSGRA
ncbi:MAG TPA: protein kinase [Candidatus Cryosericum sp.]|nr:protein kinase [Candidatus Cryosericum sp.]